jgi:hypothetical protein
LLGLQRNGDGFVDLRCVAELMIVWILVVLVLVLVLVIPDLRSSRQLSPLFSFVGVWC